MQHIFKKTRRVNIQQLGKIILTLLIIRSSLMRSMIRPVLIILVINFSLLITSAQVGINEDNSSPISSAMLDVKSTTKGMLTPRMTTAQRAAIASPAIGLLVYDITTKSFWYYDNGKWNEIRNGSEAFAFEKYSCLETTGSLKLDVNGLFPAIPINIFIKGNYAYTEYDETSFDIIDISNPTSPSLSSQVTHPYIWGSHISGNYAYVGGDYGKISIIDISNPTNPITKGSLSLSPSNGNPHYDYVYGITVVGNYAYAVGPNVINIIDINNPANPTLINTIVLPNVIVRETALVVSGNYIYINTKHDIKVLDITNPTNPTIVGQVALGTNSNGWSMTKSGNYLYVGTVGSKKLEIIDISSPTNPTISGSLAFNGAIPRLAKIGNQILAVEEFSSNNDTLRLIDVSNPANPTVVGSPYNAGKIESINVSANEDYLYVGSNKGGISGLHILKYCNRISIDKSSGQLVNVSSSEVDNQTLDITRLNGNNLELSLSNDGQATKTINLNSFLDNTDNQTLDIAQLNGDNLELSLSNDGQATKSINLGVFKDNLGSHIAGQNIQLNNHWLSNDGGNEGISISNTGHIGIGLTANNQLDIASETRTGTHATGRPLYVTGDIGARSNGIEFRHSNGTQGIGFGYNGIYAAGTDVNQDISIVPNGNGKVRISNAYSLPAIDGSLKQALISDGQGNISWGIPEFPSQISTLGINTAAANGKLEVSGVGNIITLAQMSILNSGGVVNAINNHTGQYSIYSHGPIAAVDFQAFSDKRIKNIHGISNAKSDLEQLLQIEITDYQMIDTISEGNRMYKKVIAQQVKEVYPQAVKAGVTRAVPDIYQMATIEGDWIILENDLKVGERIKIITEEKDEIYEVTKTELSRFQVKGLATGNGELATVFIYGREVKDFHTVDYEAISMLNVSATQQLAKENQILKKKVEQLETQVAKINQLEAMLQQLQQQVSTNAIQSNNSK